MGEDNIYEYEGKSYSESALREAYPDTFDDYVSEGILSKKEPEQVVKNEIQQDAEVEAVGSSYEYDGKFYAEDALREVYPDTFDEYVSQGILVKKEEPKVSVEEDSFTAFKSQEKNTLIEEMFGRNIITNVIIGDTYRAINSGLAQSDVVDPTMDLMIAGSDVTDRQLYEYIRINKELAKNQRIQDEMVAWDKAVDEYGGGVYGVFMATIENPGIAIPLMASSLATSIGSLQSEEVMAATVAGAASNAAITAGLGAAATASTGGVLAPVAVGATAISALRGGQAALQATMEATLTFNELLQEEIEGELNFENVKAVVSDPEKLSELRRKAIARGAIIGAVDYITFGIASRFAGTTLKAVKKGKSVASRAAIKTGAVVGGTAIEGAGGGAGEAAARFAIGQDMDIKEIALETIGEFGGAATSVGPAAYNNLKVVSGRVVANKTAKSGGYKNASYAFVPNTDIDQATIDLASNKNTSNVVDEQVEIEVANGRITQEEADAIKENFRATQGAVNTANKVSGLSKENKPEVINLLMEERKLKEVIKDVDNTSLTKKESNRLKEVQSRLEEIVSIKEEASVDTQEVTDSEYETLIENAVSEKELDAILDQADKADKSTPELIDAVSKKRSELTEPAVEEASEVPAEVIKLRAQEQAEMLEQVPGAEDALTDGKVDREKIATEEGKAKFDEIYIKYDEKISPLLETTPVEGVSESTTKPKATKATKPKTTKSTKPKVAKTTKPKITKATKAKPTVETKSETKSQSESKTKEISDVVAQRKKALKKYKEDSDKNFDKRKKIQDDKNLSKEEKEKKIKALEKQRDKIKDSYDKKYKELTDKKSKLEKERASLERKYKKESKAKESKRSQKESESKTNSEATKNKIRGQVERAIKAISNIAKGVTIKVYETSEEYKASGGEFDEGGSYVLSSKTIKINLEKANLRTVAHEVFHAILLNDGPTSKEAQRITSDMLDAVRRIASPELIRKLDAFASRYNIGEGLQSEESIAELFGILAENYENSSSIKKLINEWLRKLAKVLNLPIKGMLDSDKEIIEFLSVVSGKVARGEVIEQSETSILQEQKQGSEGEVGTLQLTRQQINVIDSPKAQDDQRSWVRNLVEDIDIYDLDGRKFVTNMYDYTNAGITDLGNGYSINLLGGRNYVPIIMDKTGRKLGDVSNLAAFNTKSQAEGFVRNATEGKADLFAPHSGTLNGSWQFQQHIFESLVNLVLNGNILSKQKLIDVFNSGLKSKVGKSALEKFNNKNKSKLRNLSSFKGDPKALVTLLDIENNYSPELRKILNQKIASDKTFQKAIGVKNITEFHNRMTDPLNKGVVGGEIMSFVEFDPTTFEIAKTNPKDVDHHPSFGWVVRAKIKRIMQPNKFFKSYDITDIYTKYNTDETVVSRKTEDNFAESNVLSSAGAIVKVAKANIPQTRQQRTTRLAPNGNQSNLTDVQYDLVRTPAFKNWFGDWENDPKNASKVVDENGEPMVVWRGRDKTKGDFGDIMDIGKTREGAFFADNERSADLFMSEFRGLNKNDYEVIDSYLNIRNPEVFEDFWFDFQERGRMSRKDYKFSPKKGFDGAIIQDDTWLEEVREIDDEFEVFVIGQGKQFIALDSKQIKLADGTNTTFDPDAPSIRKQIIGGSAELSQNVRDNLSVARQMETEGEDAKTIRIATGWEKGADGEWKYEIDDVKIKDDFNFRDLERIPSGLFTGKLYEIIENKKLFDSYPTEITKYLDLFEDDGSLLPFKQNDRYPPLADIRVYFDANKRYGSFGEYDPISKTITIYIQPGNSTSEQMSLTLLHEIQHYIQGREGFSTGGNLEMFINEIDKIDFSLVNGLRSFAKTVARENPEKGFNVASDSDAAKTYEIIFGKKPSPTVIGLAAKLEQEVSRGVDLNETTVYKTVKDSNLTPYEKYEMLGGEVEARNVEERMNMTPEQRRETTLQETEDVAREDQIFFEKETQTRQQKAKPLTDELVGLNESEIIKQGYLEFFSSIKDKSKDADFIYSEFVEEALDRMQSKINRIRETFKNKINRNKEARKEVRKQIAEILKNSGLDSVSKRAIKSIMRNIENATPATMQKKVAEVMDVISRDIKRQARYNRKKTLGKALSNIGKIGSLKELNNILVDALKINPQYLSEKTLVKYDKIISSLASVNKKFDMPSRVELKNLAEGVITSFQADYKLAQEIIRERINNNLDSNKSVLENLKQMKKEKKITDSEYNLLVRFKDQINKTKKENISEEDKAKTAQERRNEATEDFEAAIQGIPKSFKDLNDDERSVLRIVKTLTLKDLDNFTTNEIQNLVRGLEGLQAGYIGSDLIQSIDNIKADRLSKNTATGETLERGVIDKLLTRAKTTVMNIFRPRDKQVTPIMERIRSTPLKNIDQILNDAAKGFKSTKIYENIFRPTGVAFEAASKKLKTAKKDLDKAGAFLNIGINKRYAQKVKIMIYQIQREYDSNGGKKANAELVTAISMINHTLKDPLVDLSDRERATIEKIRDEYLSINGEIDADKIFNSFTDKEKKSLALIDKVYSDIQEMARMDAARQGLPFVLRKNYVHLPRITKSENTMTSEEEFEALADNFSKPVSMKSKALFQRNGKPHSISFDPIYNANAISRKATVSYYMVPAVKIGKRVLANLKDKAKTDYQKDLFNSLEEVYDSIIRSEYKNVTKDRAFIEKALSFLGRSGYLAQLSGPVKAAVELASNATHAILYNPVAFNEGYQVLNKIPKDTINKALNNVFSTNVERLTTDEGGNKDVEQRLYASVPLFQQEQMTSDFGDRIGTVIGVLKRPAKAFIKFNEDLITKPDSLVAKPLFIGAFSASFEESTGQKPNWEKIANDKEYRDKFDSAIRKASEDGDTAVIDNAASNNPFDAIPKNILDRDASAMKQAIQTVNRYMSRFRTFEYYSALKGVQSMIGKGDLTKSQGALLLTATIIRMSMYKMAIDMSFSIIFSLLGLDDEDDEKEIDKEVSKGV